MSTQPPVPTRHKILVLDDDPIIQRAVNFALRDHGYEVLMCGDVANALKLIRTERPSLILVDLSFPLDASSICGPLQDGFFIIDWIRRTEGVGTAPIVIISGTEPAKYKARADSLGIKVCLQKPITKEALLKAVQTSLAESTPPGQPEAS